MKLYILALQFSSVEKGWAGVKDKTKKEGGVIRWS